MFPETNQPIALDTDLVNLATYRKQDRTAGNLPDPLLVLVAYAQDELVYDAGRITTTHPKTYAELKASPLPEIRNRLVNKFGLAYQPGTPLLLHRRLADVQVDVAIDMRNRYRQFTVVMDGLRTFESGERMQTNRPDLVASGMLAKSGTSAHNRALAVDSKLFDLLDPLSFETWTGDVPLSQLVEADEHGHLDDEQPMQLNSRFYTGPMSRAARKNRDRRLQSWQRASVRNRTPIANLLAEFWDDRVPGSPADMWRILTCRALCIGVDGNPATNPAIRTLKTQLEHLTEHTATRHDFAAQAHEILAHHWNLIFTPDDREELDALLAPGAGSPPPLQDFLFHEWLTNIHDRDIAHLIG